MIALKFCGSFTNYHKVNEISNSFSSEVLLKKKKYLINRKSDHN